MLKKNKYTFHRLMLQMLDIFYPVFRKVMPKQVYRFLAVGGVCFLINIIVFHFSYHLYDSGKFGPLPAPAYIAAFFTSLSITVLVGFYLNKNYVFRGSVLEKRTQFFRFCYSTVLEAIISYYLLRFFVEGLHWHPSLALIAGVAVIQTANYFIQKHYSFKRTH
ncbi:GtrA family protein [Haoranjiania flava]|uniref:GtrA family protein n=1 Tax=Haoranjiania flava TaxID=1856322 RepID=A0AAE3LJW0_9BACT|nr:GtrA family protein [Haoranjiania flava]MCU7693973.1 GtrA family protein [Haoranjiania flava]